MNPNFLMIDFSTCIDLQLVSHYEKSINQKIYSQVRNMNTKLRNIIMIM